MTKTKSTKKALFVSILSLVICLSMLIGTTFAWFTDSVTSGINKIIAGNLDIELYHDDKGTDGFEKVYANTKLFDDIALWEPGAVVYENFKVVNEGTLALKYVLSFLAENATEVKGASIVDALKIAVVENGFDGNRDKAKALTNYVDFESFNLSDELLTKDASNVYGIVIYWEPTADDNKFNMNNENQGKTLSVDIGVSLVATQMTHEADSFDKFFDADAEYPVTKVITKTDAAESIVVDDNFALDLPANAPAGTYTVSIDNVTEEVDDEGKTSIAFDLELLLNGAPVEAQAGVTYTVKLYIGKNLDIASVLHKGVAIAAWDYEPTEGILSFETDSFSPFEVILEDINEDTVFAPAGVSKDEIAEMDAVAVDENGNTYANITAAIKSGASKLWFKEGADLGAVTHLDLDHSVTIYGNGAYISAGERDFAIEQYVSFTSDVNVVIYNLHGVALWGTRSTDYTFNATLYNCNNIGRYYINGTTGVNNVSFYNCSADKATLIGDTVIYSNANGSIFVDGCTFKNIGCPVNINHKVAGTQKVTVLNSTFIDCATDGTAAYYAPIRLYNSAEGANQVINISGNTFTYSEGKAPINSADVLLNAKHNGADASGTITGTVQVNATVSAGANVEVVYTVANADELKGFAAEVNKGEEYASNTFAGKTIVLTADIDLEGAEWTPIGYFGLSSKPFCGTFDGNGHTISNFKITEKPADKAGKNRSSIGLFGNVNGTIKNLTVANATVIVTNDGRFVGGLIGRLNGGLVENCKLISSTVEGSAWQIGGIVGQVNSGLIKGCTVKDTTVTGKAGVGAIAGFQMDKYETNIENCTVTGCAINQKGSYGDEDYDNMFAAILGCVNNSDSTVNIKDCTVENTTVKGEKSASVVGYIEDGATVTVNGYKYLANGLYKLESKNAYAVSNAEGLVKLNAMMANKSAGQYTEVVLWGDIDMAGKTWTPVDSHADSPFFLTSIDGQGHTIKNLTINGQAMFTRFAGFGDVTIKDITFDNATVTSNSINTAILTGHTYQNVLLDNVDVKDSSITGGYKVATLVGTVYNENTTTITATLKNCDVTNVTVKALSYDFCTTGMVAFVYADDNDKIAFENSTVSDVKLYAPNVYTAHAAVYTTGSETLFNEVEGVTVTNVTFENI